MEPVQIRLEDLLITEEEAKAGLKPAQLLGRTLGSLTLKELIAAQTRIAVDLAAAAHLYKIPAINTQLDEEDE